MNQFPAIADPDLPGALIIAAGYASRMGAFKPLLALEGKTVLDCAVGLFRQAGIADITVVIGHRADQLTPVLDRLAVRQVVNPQYDSGMYSSVAAGFSALPPTLRSCFFLPADMPLVRSRTIRALLDAQRPAAVLYPTFGGRRGHPPLVARALFSEIVGGDGAGGLKTVLRRHNDAACELPVCDEGILLDLDRPADYAAALAKGRWIDIPSPAECLAILNEQKTPENVVRHVLLVADVAATLAAALAERGLPLDVNLVRAGAMLHDVAKGQPRHAAVGAEIVERMGFPQVARLVADHSDPKVADGTLDERAIVYLADKLVQADRVVDLTERFRRGVERFSDDADAMAGAARRKQAALRIAAVIEAQLNAPLSAVISRRSVRMQPTEMGGRP